VVLRMRKGVFSNPTVFPLKKKTGQTTVRLRFSVNQHKVEINLMRSFIAYLKCGRVSVLRVEKNTLSHDLK